MTHESTLRVNLGAGKEVIKGWKSLDLPPEQNPSFEDITLTPDIVADLPNIPLPDNSVSTFRTKDLLMDYQMASDLPINQSLDALGSEIRRCLKPGGRLITIEVPPLSKAFAKYLRVVSITPGALLPYFEKTPKRSHSPRARRFRVTVYVKEL